MYNAIYVYIYFNTYCLLYVFDLYVEYYSYIYMIAYDMYFYVVVNGQKTTWLSRVLKWPYFAFTQLGGGKHVEAI